MTIYRRTLLALIVLVLIAGCAPVAAPAKPPQSSYTDATEPYWPTAGWRTSTPEQQGMDSEMLARMLEDIAQKKPNLHSLLVIRHGTLVAEVYFPGNSVSAKHALYSVTKSFTSALVGIALNKGCLDSVKHPVLDLFAGRPVAQVDARKQAMTVEHLLTMSSGLEWPESAYPYTSMANPYVGMMRSADGAQFVMDQPMEAEPGTQFNYNSGSSHVLSAIVAKTCGKKTLAFAQENLFGPLGISDLSWSADPSGVAIGGSELSLTPRDMAKFGYLYLHQGTWAGRQVVPAEYVKASVAKHIDTGEGGQGYGYQWWINPGGSFAAHGLGGQRIDVWPEQDMVIVFTAWLTGDETIGPDALIRTYIVPAARSTTALPENPAALARLQALIKAAGGR